MRKMLLLIAIMALATGAFAAWTSTEEMRDTTLTDDLIGGIGTTDATIYAKFKILGPEFTINSGGSNDMWAVEGFLPGDYGWASDPFTIENTGGVTLNLGLLATDMAGGTVTHVDAAYASGWAGTVNTYKIFSVIYRSGGTPPAMDGTDATALNCLNFTGADEGWYNNSGAAYMVPSSSEYWHATGHTLNLWAADAGGGSNDDECDLYLGAQIPFEGWTVFTDQLVTISVYGDLTTETH